MPLLACSVGNLGMVSGCLTISTFSYGLRHLVHSLCVEGAHRTQPYSLVCTQSLKEGASQMESTGKQRLIQCGALPAMQ